MKDTGLHGVDAETRMVFRADCPSRPILDQIADKWSMMVMALLERPTRFNELKRSLEGITQRVLTQTLRRLERNGMIHRTVLPTSPVGVEYSLTPLGESLREPFGHLYDWTVEHSEEIQSSQRAYDARVDA
ncbi:helix-turn-helix transcriptional regulator [Streptomyces spinosirectus]|jgi:DNA-binding HxlR family transcriptional regulator|uniref:winged helix-turn-helix transcriptional regulator n=1 Tax=Streptomyces TaxID=1883 RepID=UPI000D3807B2|nr:MULTISPECIES: helix-turn-helix domain-containing protein [Streptomyces]MBY8343458.1 helix-turn-helix transcriptional regulator [Streptomyces plumbidurans]PTM86501.1 HxlR family transcriptional regulator [Streptomyces sp. VMFN-G11Ma]UIR22545.1 helix-turn-helix transcriptional regulator [Streptomyces spinosirectus]